MADDKHIDLITGQPVPQWAEDHLRRKSAPTDNPEEVLRAALHVYDNALTDYTRRNATREIFRVARALAATSVKVQPVDGVEEATREARELAISLHRKHFPEVMQWQPLDDLRGIISQIDNMTTALSRHSAPSSQEPKP